MGHEGEGGGGQKDLSRVRMTETSAWHPSPAAEQSSLALGMLHSVMNEKLLYATLTRKLL